MGATTPNVLAVGLLPAQQETLKLKLGQAAVRLSVHEQLRSEDFADEELAVIVVRVDSVPTVALVEALLNQRAELCAVLIPDGHNADGVRERVTQSLFLSRFRCVLSNAADFASHTQTMLMRNQQWTSHRLTLSASTETLKHPEFQREAALTLNRVLELLPSGVAVVSPGGRLLDHNPAAAELLPALKRSAETIFDAAGEANRPALERLLVATAGDPGDNPSTAHRCDLRIATDGDPGRTIEARATNLSGRVLLVLADVSAARRERDALDAMVRAQTVTLEQRAAELKEVNADLERVALMASNGLREASAYLTRFTTELSTEHRQELNSAGRSYLDVATAAARRVAQLTEELIRVSGGRLDVPPLAEVSLQETFEDAVRNLSNELDQARAAVFGHSLPLVHGRRHQLQYLFEQLLANAIEAHTNGGELRVDVQAERQGPMWLVSFTDNTRAIDAGAVERIFQLKHTLDPDLGPGVTGLHLALCKKLVESHAGKIWVLPHADVGNTFQFTLPTRPSTDPPPQ